MVHSQEELPAVLGCPFERRYVLGGGSNVLFAGDFPGLVLLNRIGGIRIEEEDGGEVLLSAGGGVNWHELVLWTLNHHIYGLENLSLIPGTVGAAPIQNIGAYGVELRDVFHSLQAVELATGEMHTFGPKACEFGYRDSVFKRERKGDFFITRVFLRLSRKPRLNLTYGAIGKTLAGMGVSDPSPKDVSRAVVHIRQSKLPDPAQIGNAGSFFKNPEVPVEVFDRLREQFPDIVSYPLPGGRVKVPAGWLIERAGWKGRRIGNTGCYDHQALVIVNYGGATGAEIWAHARRVADSVEETFGLRLHPEVNVVGQAP